MTTRILIFVPAAFIMLTGCGSSGGEPPAPLPARTSVQAAPAPSANAPDSTGVPMEAPRRSALSEPRHTPPPRRNIPFRRGTRESPRQSAAPEAQRQLARHETEYDAKDKNRSNNIARAAQAINGHIVQPGQEFSYNETVGPTIQRRGYKKGTIFIKGEKSKGYGGGVCQVSSTLCSAAANAGMTITERHDHSLPVSYAEEGQEAATSYGGIDFKFQNDKPFPIIIHAKAESGTVSVTISAM